MESKGIKVIAKNKKARHEYFIEDTYEAGIELYGTEVKSIRAGKVNLKESHADIKNGEVFVFNMHISPYEMGNINNKDPLRMRKLLLHKSEIRKLIGLKQQQGYTLVPLSLYFKGSKVKVELALAVGKKIHDKRHALASKDATRRMARAMRQERDE
ncbi:SsrA-binding protein SmpB [Alkalibaculum sp. M08DMB]|uniref:SsrA-binding protein n=1 Tax=Alkalibaculum sporogenes TaxID=2655001 RepID=A0A6A7K8V4_9FIRM|nr:SsrA-binding protein SmpB [Alkalibaculum sporogenes]MPW25939.1 SsrA-binding protein SmpB [Alkalibaculum sporogenes]